MTERTPLVLVVDDEPGLADLYAAWLGEEYATRVAYGGGEAIESVDERVDVALLDRRMPERTGDEVLREIDRRGLDCQVAMVTAVQPDLDVLELEFDGYLTKPVSQDELLDLVGELVRRKQYDSRMSELLSLLSRRATLQAELSEAELERSDDYRALVERIEEVRTDADGIVGDMDGRETEALLRQVTDAG